MTTLSDFITAERERYADGDNNLFAFSLFQAQRYYDFILIIADRHKEASQNMVLNQTKMMDSLSTHGDGPMTDKQMNLFVEGQRLSTLVHLEIESFYLFAKIFLDKIALFFQNYFGQAHNISLASHDKLTKSYEQYRAAKDVVYPDGFSECLQFLKEQVCDYRDKQISHLQNPRAIKATSWNNESGQTRIAVTRLYPNPNERDEQVESRELPELISTIDGYIQQVIMIVELNRTKTRYRLKGMG